MSKVPSPRRLIDAVVAAQQAIDGLPEDERLRIDTVDGETELFELMDRYAEAAIADRLLIDLGERRLARLAARADRSREVVRKILQAVGITEGLERPLYSANLTYRQRAHVSDADQLPRQYVQTKEAIDTRALERDLKRGADIPGAQLTNPEASLLLTTR
jgi:Siphovirus Gp157